MAAKMEQEDLLIYGLDLIWLLAKSKYHDATFPQPSKATQKKDNRTANQIRRELIKKFSK